MEMNLNSGVMEGTFSVNLKLDKSLSYHKKLSSFVYFCAEREIRRDTNLIPYLFFFKVFSIKNVLNLSENISAFV